MTGLMPKRQPPQAQRASPEDQAAYNGFVKNGLRVIFNKQAVPAVIASLKAVDDPVRALANTLSMVLQRLVASASKSGVQVPQNVVVHAASELEGHLAELAGEGGVHKFNKQELAQALQLGLQAYAAMSAQSGAPGAQPDQPGQPAPAPAPADQQGQPAPAPGDEGEGETAPPPSPETDLLGLDDQNGDEEQQPPPPRRRGLMA
jgi:hypothetical protein